MGIEQSKPKRSSCRRLSFRKKFLLTFMLIFSLEVVNGSIMFENGDKYIGDFKNGELNGSGTYYYRNGDIYKGEW